MSDIASAIKQICGEKGLSYEAVLETIESALAAAYRKDFGEKNQNIRVEFNPETNKSKIFDVKVVVEDMPEEDEEKDKEDKEDKSEEEEKRRFNPKTEIQLSDARLIKKTAKIGDEIKTRLDIPEAFGRMAAQTAKQVIIQKLREAEREMIFRDFKDKEKEVVTGIVQRRENNMVLVDLGKAVGILPLEEQIANERYAPGDRVKVYVKEVKMVARGPEIVLSRTSEEILKKIFYLEIPEISNGLIEIKTVAREAGSRSKIAVQAINKNVDPIGSCVGQRGARIQTIINELGGEKVDIIEYDEDSAKFIINSLSPAKILNIKIDEKRKEAKGIVASDQLSLAIGKGGQNVRLAARLTGWRIDIVEEKIGEDTEKVKEEEKKAKKEDERSKEGKRSVEQKDEETKKQKNTKEKDEDDKKEKRGGKKGEEKEKEDKKKTDKSKEAGKDNGKEEKKERDKINKDKK